MIMAFFTHAADQDPWSPPFPFNKLFNSLLDYSACHKYGYYLNFARLQISDPQQSAAPTPSRGLPHTPSSAAGR
jgi:hypothetical protein